MKILTDKTAFITGAASGIGLEVSRLFAREGAFVIMADIVAKGEDYADMLRREGCKANYAVCDVACIEQVQRSIDMAFLETGRFDFLINCAGIADRDNVTETDEETWNRVVAINLNGVFFTMKYAIPYMIQTGGGAIVNIGSLSAVLHRSSGIGDAYVASKGGVNSLTRSVAIKYAKHGIRANTILPGTIVTPMNAAAYEEWDPRVPLGRLGEPAEVARAALYLVSEASSYITATELFVDGGSHAAIAPSRRRKH